MPDSLFPGASRRQFLVLTAGVGSGVGVTGATQRADSRDNQSTTDTPPPTTATGQETGVPDVLTQDLPDPTEFITADHTTLERGPATVTIDTRAGTVQVAGGGDASTVTAIAGYLAAEAPVATASWDGVVNAATRQIGTAITDDVDLLTFDRGSFAGIAFQAVSGVTLRIDDVVIDEQLTLVRYTTDHGFIDAAVGGTRADPAATDQTGWPMAKGGPARTGAAPGATGPTPPVNVKWEFSHPASFPAVVGDTVFIGGTTALYALDARSGDERWRFAQATGAISAPVVTGDTVYVGAAKADENEGGANLLAIDATTGQELWRFAQPSGGIVVPAVADDTVYVATIPWDENNPGKTMYAVDATTGDERWRFNHPTGGGVAPVVVDDTVYVGSRGDAGTVYALETQSGAERWRFKPPDGGTIAPAVANGTVFVGSQSKAGNVYAIDAKTGYERWQFTAADWAIAPPAVAGDTLYVGTIGQDNVFAIDTKTGDERWRFTQATGVKTTPFINSPVVAGGTVYIVTVVAPNQTSGTQTADTKVGVGPALYAIDAAAGDEHWQVLQPPQLNKVVRWLAVAGDTLYVAGKALYALE